MNIPGRVFFHPLGALEPKVSHEIPFGRLMGTGRTNAF